MLLGIACGGAGAVENAAQALTQQRRAEAHWLTLESERRAFEKGNPGDSAERTRMRQQRLRQQGLRDRDQGLRSRQAVDQRRQRARAQPPVSGSASTRREALGIRRQERGTLLQNRMQRNTWPRDR